MATILVPRRKTKPSTSSTTSSTSSTSTTNSTTTTTQQSQQLTVVEDLKFVQANRDLHHIFEQPNNSNTTSKEDLPALYEIKFRSDDPLSSAYLSNEATLNRMGVVIEHGRIPSAAADINYNRMRGFIASEITNDGGEHFFGDMLGFSEYTQVLNFSSAKQVKHVQRIQQPYHIQLMKTKVPSFLQLWQWVEQRCIQVYAGLEIMYFDLLHQGLDTSTVYRPHQDNDFDNNPGDASIYRTLIVKISAGVSVSVNVCGHPCVMHYDDHPGCFIDFRSDAWHHSVMPDVTSNFIENYKIVFFLGRNGRIDDGRGEDDEIGNPFVEGGGGTDKKRKR